MTKQELINKINEASKARKVEATERIEVIKLENELNYINSDKYVNDQVTLADDAVLLAITKPLDSISDRHFARYQEFNFGTQANALIGAIRTIQFQKKAGREALNEAIALNPELSYFASTLELRANAFPDVAGRNTYFDKLTGSVVPGAIGNAHEMRAILETVAREIGLAAVNFSQINQDKLQVLEDKAVIKANTQYEDNKLLDPSNNDEVADIVYKTA
jgi:hypothetical protein